MLQEKETGAVFLSMEYDKENWELKIEIRQADIIPEDDDKEKCSKLYIQSLNCSLKLLYFLFTYYWVVI